jgi:hypothetical protein
MSSPYFLFLGYGMAEELQDFFLQFLLTENTGKKESKYVIIFFGRGGYNCIFVPELLG